MTYIFTLELNTIKTILFYIGKILAIAERPIFLKNKYLKMYLAKTSS